MLVVDEFIEPTTTTDNRCDKARAGFRAYGALIVGPSGGGKKDLAAALRWLLMPSNADDVASFGGVLLTIIYDSDRNFLRMDHDLRLVCRDDASVIDGRCTAD